MSDSLPPLSKFSFGFKLDPWQKRVLRWIDAGKSVVICAPTSSGKTVLSTYVAMINQNFKFNADDEKDKKKFVKSGAGAGAPAAAGDQEGGYGSDVDEVVSDDEEEEDGWDAEVRSSASLFCFVLWM
jgi:energy-coupling factor transporter ATP-binding protein EcfA2